MAWELSIKGNYFYAIQNVDPFTVHEYPACNVRVGKKFTGSTEFTFFYKGKSIQGMCNLPMLEILAENGTDFTDLATFETWKNDNTGCYDDANGGGGGNPTTGEQSITQETNTNVPAGFRSVTISRLSGTVTVDAGNGTFQLGGGSNPRAITYVPDNFGDEYGLTPTITISGGTWQWSALNSI